MEEKAGRRRDGKIDQKESSSRGTGRRRKETISEPGKDKSTTFLSQPTNCISEIAKALAHKYDDEFSKRSLAKVNLPGEWIYVMYHAVLLPPPNIMYTYNMDFFYPAPI